MYNEMIGLKNEQNSFSTLKVTVRVSFGVMVRVSKLLGSNHNPNPNLSYPNPNYNPKLTLTLI